MSKPPHASPTWPVRGFWRPAIPRRSRKWLAAHEPVHLPAGSPSAVDVLLEVRSDDRAETLDFVTLDRNLARAAQLEGVRVVAG